MLAALAVLLGLLTVPLSCSPPKAAAEEPSPPVASPKNGGVLRMQIEAPTSLDPADADSVYNSLPVGQIFDGLVAIDAGMRIIPALASQWTISRDGRVYTFKLRPNVTFHDGTPLTSDDVVFTFRRCVTAGHAQSNIAASYVDVIEGMSDFMAGRRHDLPGVTAEGPLSVKITLETPYTSFLQVLALDGLRIVPRRLIERIGDKSFDRAPVGTGPFAFSAWTSDHLTLTASPTYWGGRAHVDGIDIGFLPEGEMDAGVESFLRGEIDLFEAGSTEALQRLETDPHARIHRFQELNTTFLGLGVKHPPLDDVRVRRAIAHAIDVPAIVRDAARMRRAATGILPPGLQCYSPEPKVLAYDPDESRRLLEQAGHPQGRGLQPIELVTISRTGAAARLTESIRRDLAAIGLVVRVRDLSWADLNERIDSHTAPLFKLSWVADLNDPDSFLRSPFESGGPSNFFGYSDPETDELLRRGEREMNPVTRARIYRAVEKRVLEQAPLVPLYHPVDALATKNYVHGLEPGPLGISVLDLEKVWLSRPGETR